MDRPASPRRLEKLASSVLFVGLAFGIADSVRVVFQTSNKPLTLATLALG